MKKLFYSLVLCLVLGSANSQTYLIENFNYSANDTLTNNGWTVTAANVTNVVRANATGLTYTGYVGSGIGTAAALTNNGQDLYKDASASISSGSVYVSFLANFSAALTGDYFFALLPPTSTTSLTSRLFVKQAANANYYKVAITKSTEAAVYSNDSFAIGSTQFFVVKYTFNTVSTLDDSIRLYVFNSGVPATEPSSYTATLVTPPTAADAAAISRVCLRQGSATLAPTVIVDGIRFGTTWGNTALPVNLTSFTATKLNTEVLLKWSTSSELNNHHFEIEKSSDNINFFTIGEVKGQGNSNFTLNYSFIDGDLLRGTTFYRLKQVDMDGNADCSKTVTLSNELVKNVVNPLPNPFSSDITIHVNAASAANAAVEVLDILGKVHYSGTEILSAGDNNIHITTQHFNNGIYFVRVNVNGEVTTQKIIKR